MWATPHIKATFLCQNVTIQEMAYTCLQVCGMYLINVGQQMVVDVMEPMAGGKHTMSFQSWSYHFITA